MILCWLIRSVVQNQLQLVEFFGKDLSGIKGNAWTRGGKRIPRI
jgi:hypothetical protein